MIYGVRNDLREQLKGARKEEQLKSLVTPSVYFLAPNHRRSELKNRSLRLAIAHALNRRELLADLPGDDQSKKELTGPFPLGCWACSHESFAFDSRLVRGHLADCADEVNGMGELSLVFPLEDDKAEKACEKIKEALAKHNIQIRLAGAASTDFYRRVLVDHSFDLVYWRHYYSDEMYSIDSLVDRNATAPGGSNFLGYDPDKELAEVLRDLQLHKKFDKVQELMRRIHEHVFRTAFVIPLWQLDETVAIHDSVLPARLDPLELFGEVQDWQCQPDL
jgi:ABC-type oligopeptide transport system substrate-binding subunit